MTEDGEDSHGSQTTKNLDSIFQDKRTVTKLR